MLGMVRIRTGVGVEEDFFKSDNMCLHVVFFMMRNSSLTKVITRQYNTKINTSSQFRFKSIKQACKKDT